MDTLNTIVSLFFIFELIAGPVFLFLGIKKWYRYKFDFLPYLILSHFLTALLLGTLAWWADYSDYLIMS
jgi:hypothetical protein